MSAVRENLEPADAAAQWFVLLASGEASDTDRERCLVWRAAHPAHEQAWQRAQRAVAHFAEVPRAQAQVSVETLKQAPPSPGRRRALFQLSALVAVAVAGWGGYRRSDWSADFVTARGEARDVMLADGSQVRMDTDTALDILYSGHIRLLRLRRGRIMIETAHAPADVHRPFVVETAQGRVRALGTRFSVRQESEATDVSVVAARVALHPAQGQGEAMILHAGESARFDRHRLLVRERMQPADTAWTRGLLVADDMRLDDWTAELARYREAAILLDPALQGLRISGTFPLTDPEHALAALAGVLPVRIERRADRNGQVVLAIQPK